MQTEEFISRIQQTGETGDTEATRKIALATVETLCMHLSSEETRRMASQLPAELSDAARKGQQQAGEPQARVDLATFYDQVATRANMSADSVKAPVAAVIDVFKQAVTRGELADVTFDLPPDVNTLLAS